MRQNRKSEFECMQHNEQETFFSILQEGIRFLDKCKADMAFTKEDVITGMEERICIMMKKMLSTPTSTSYCLFRVDPCSVP